MNPTKKKADNWRSFEKACKFVRGLGLKGQAEWQKWIKSGERPNDIPSNPARVYKDKGWIDWGDWLGTERTAYQNRKYRTFSDARLFVHSLGLKSEREWNKWAKSQARPEDIPITPRYVYKNDGWAGTGDWLGTERAANQNRIFHPFQEAREFVRSLHLRNKDEWSAWVKSNQRLIDIPAAPARTYKDHGWVNWGDWLGTRNKKGGYRKFEEAREYVHSLNFQSKEEWRVWAKGSERPNDIPAGPSRTYKDNGWQGWGDWLVVCWLSFATN